MLDIKKKYFQIFNFLKLIVMFDTNAKTVIGCMKTYVIKYVIIVTKK